MYKKTMVKPQETTNNWSTDPNYTNLTKILHPAISTIQRNENLQPSPSPKTYPEKRYWKWTFVLTLLPFFLWGVPVHLLFGKQRITSTRDWFKNLFTYWPNPLSGILTLILLLATIVANGFVLYCIGDVIYLFVIIAQPNESFLTDINFLLQTIPVIIPLNYVWFFGYKIRNVISAFDRLVVPITRHYTGPPPINVSTQPSGRVKLITMYIMLIIVHVIHCLVVEYNNASYKESSKESKVYFWISYTVGAVMYTFMLPVYATFCWCITYEFQILASYIGILMEEQQPAKIELLDNFKRAYKRTADHVMQINKWCALYLSWVLITLAFNLYVEFYDIWKNVFMTLFEQEEDGTINFKPEVIRSLVGDTIVILTEAALVVFTIWQAVRANDEARYLHVWLNDFVTSPEAGLSTEVYQAFRMLKFYVHSRMEQPKPALLYISILSVIPVIKYRLTSYNIYH